MKNCNTCKYEHLKTDEEPCILCKNNSKYESRETRELNFLQAMQALANGEIVEYHSSINNPWSIFDVENNILPYSSLINLKWRIKLQKKRIAKALCRDTEGCYFETEYYFESLENLKAYDVIKFPHGDWIEI